MSYKLSSPAEADTLLADLLSGAPDQTCQIMVREDRCFLADQLLNLGAIYLKAELNEHDAQLNAIRQGAYEWKVPPIDKVQDELNKLLQLKAPTESAKKNDKIAYSKAVGRAERTLQSVAFMATRLGFLMPCFDARSVEDMPFKRAVTIVADTTSVVQGALDFAAKFLHPVARIKVPAIVHMEIVNQADRFLNQRRSIHPNASAVLLDHVLSQGAQRTLLRLELQPETEIERTAVFGDPLRSAFQQDKEEGLSDLNLSVPLRSYCDRLII